jgi:formylglycine-generating enzyme required for sulfatase activity
MPQPRDFDEIQQEIFGAYQANLTAHTRFEQETSARKTAYEQQVTALETSRDTRLNETINVKNQQISRAYKTSKESEQWLVSKYTVPWREYIQRLKVRQRNQLILIAVVIIVLLAIGVGIVLGVNALSEMIATSNANATATQREVIANATATERVIIANATATELVIIANATATERVIIANATATFVASYVPVESDFDGVTMVQVPAGCFQMGSNDGDSDEQPVHEQCFDAPFWIDKYEVTQAQFREFGGRQSKQPDFLGDNRPVENITWFEADAFCELRGARLPTEAEWEYAARGPENRIYPWGNQWNENNAVWEGNSNRRTADVGSRPAGVSWVGAYDMSGNVWEWTSSSYEPYPYDAGDGRESDTGGRTDVLRVLRGGSWLNYVTVNLRAPDRYRIYPIYWFLNLGFRCARSS